MQHATKRLLKTAIVCFIVFNVYNESQAGIGKFVGSFAQAASSAGVKAFEATTKFTAAVFSKIMVAIWALSKYIYQGSCYLLKNVVIKPIGAILNLLLKLCGKIIMGIQSIFKFFVENSFLRSIISNFIKALTNFFKFSSKLFLKSLEKIYEYVIEPLLRLAKWCVENTIKFSVKTVTAILDYVIKPFFNFLGNVIKYSVKYTVKLLEKIWEYVIHPVLRFARWCIENIIKYGVKTVEAILDYVIKPFFNFLGNVIKYSVKYTVKLLEKIWEYVIHPVFKFIKWCVTKAIHYGVKIVDAILEYVIKPFFNFLGNVIKYSVKYTVKLLEKIWEYVIHPVFKFIKWCVTKAIHYGVKIVDAILEYVIKPFFNFLGNVIKYSVKYTVKLLEKIWEYVIKPILNFAKSCLQFGKKVIVKIWECVIEPTLRFLGRCAQYIFARAKDALAFCKKILIKVSQFILDCLKSAAEFIKNAIVKCFEHVIMPILRFIYKCGSFVLRQMWNTILFTVGLLPFVLHKMREMVIKDELEEVDNPNEKMKFAKGAYVNKFKCHDETPVEFAFRNKFKSVLKTLIEEQGAEVPDEQEVGGFENTRKHGFFLPRSTFEDFIKEKRKKQTTLKEKIEEIMQEANKVGYDKEKITALLKAIRKIYNDSQTPARTKQECLINLLDLHKKGLLSAQELKYFFNRIPFTQDLFTDPKFAVVLEFAKTPRWVKVEGEDGVVRRQREYVLDVNERSIFEVGAACGEGDPALTEILKEHDPLYSEHDLFKEWLKKRPYPKGFRGFFSKAFHYVCNFFKKIKKQFCKDYTYSAKKDFVGAMNSARRKCKTFNDPAHKKRFRDLANRFIVLNDLKRPKEEGGLEIPGPVAQNIFGYAYGDKLFDDTGSQEKRKGIYFKT
ncbi:hypothetical protein ACFLYA_01060, partial [Candidatus Dependentiae bacterium]